MRQELCEFILGTERISFGHKIQVFQALINKYKHQYTIQTSPLYEDLGSIVKRRNRLAHYQLSIRIEDAINYKKNGDITLISYTNRIEFNIYPKAKFQSYLNLIIKCMNAINNLNKKLYGNKPT